MKKKTSSSTDVTKVMIQIQEQLAALDKKLETFMTKSLTELAQALAAQKPAPAPRVIQAPPQPAAVRSSEPRRPMFAIVCYECGKDAELPFKPSPGRPVYCKECFSKHKTHNSHPVSSEPKNLPAPVAPSTPVSTKPLKKTKTAVVKKAAPKKKTAPKKK